MKTYKQLGITKEQRANLKKLADYLSSGKLKAKFDMSDYASYGYWDNATNCGSVGCAVGHGPYAGIKKPKDQSWNDYAAEKFGAHLFEPSLEEERIYDFLFNQHWGIIHPTAKQAAKRIYLFLEKGLPSNFIEVRDGVEKRFKYIKAE